MYAVIKTGGKQIKVSKDDIVQVERLAASEGESVAFESVLLVNDGTATTTGTPHVEGATVTGEVVKQTRAPTILVFKKIRRHHHRRKNGHRQLLTAVRITDILTGGKKPAKKTAAKAAAKDDGDTETQAAETKAKAQKAPAKKAPAKKATAKPAAKKASAAKSALDKAAADKTET
jgi:large subunit ribosomal protein L21